MKETLKSKIFKALDKTGYLTDSQAFRLADKDVGFGTIEEYKRKWSRLKFDREFFEDKKIVNVQKGHRAYYAEIDTGELYKIGKDFYEENKLCLTS